MANFKKHLEIGAAVGTLGNMVLYIYISMFMKKPRTLTINLIGVNLFQLFFGVVHWEH